MFTYRPRLTSQLRPLRFQTVESAISQRFVRILWRPFLGYGVSQQATQHLYILGQYQFKLFDFIETHFVKNEI